MHTDAKMSECVFFNFSQVSNSCVNISNVNRNETDFNATLYDIYNAITLIICLFGFIVNILNIIAILNAPGKLTSHSKLVISLAVSDICVVLPSLLTQISMATLLVGDVNLSCYYHVVVHKYIEPGVVLVSLLNLLMLGIDHYIAIVKPLHYDRILSTKRLSACVAFIWIFSFVVSVIETIYKIISYFKSNEDQFCLYMMLEYLPRFPYLLVIPVFIVLVIIYTRIYVAYTKYVTRRQIFHPDDQHNNKAIVTTLLIIITFMIGWVPVSVMTIISTIYYTGVRMIFNDWLWFILVMCGNLILLNSSCDALIYAWRLEVVKQGYKIVLTKLCRKCRIRLAIGQTDTARPRIVLQNMV